MEEAGELKGFVSLTALWLHPTHFKVEQLFEKCAPISSFWHTDCQAQNQPLCAAWCFQQRAHLLYIVSLPSQATQRCCGAAYCLQQASPLVVKSFPCIPATGILSHGLRLLSCRFWVEARRGEGCLNLFVFSCAIRRLVALHFSNA